MKEIILPIAGRAIRFVLVVPLALLLSQACGGDDDEDTTEAPTSATTTQVPVTATSTPAVSVSGEEGSFEQLAAAYLEGVDGKVVYKVDSENFGFHPVGTWSTYRIGSDIREDWTTNIVGFDETTIAINTAAGMFLCTKTEVSANCTIVTDVVNLNPVLIRFTPIKDLPLALLTDEALDYDVADLPNENIAGVDARCFQVSVHGRIGEGPPGGEEIKLCFSPDGALLAYDRLVTFEAAGLPPARLTAIAESQDEASDADMQPISPPVDVGN
jgi:hypothetical protein